MRFADHFSGHAVDYARARPTYPDRLFEWLATLPPARERAWDAGCGNGQATLSLAAHFKRVIGTDPSAAQIASAVAHPRVEYRIEPADASTLDDSSVDLLLVAQALHWFPQEAFHREAARVLKSGGVFAALSYGLSTVEANVDRVFGALYAELDPWWPPERQHVEDGYRNLPFPYPSIEPTESFAMGARWNLAQYLAYLRSWSASQRCLRETGRDAVAGHEASMARAWGEPGQRREVSWPLTLRVGYRD